MNVRAFHAVHGTQSNVEVVPLGERVLVRARMGGRGVSSGVDAGLEAYVLHEPAGGKITRMRPYPDRESAEAAAG